MTLDTSVVHLMHLFSGVGRRPGSRFPTPEEALAKAEATDGLTQERWLEIAAILEIRAHNRRAA